MNGIGSENQREIPSPGTCSLKDREGKSMSYTYVREYLKNPGMGAGMGKWVVSSLRDNPNQCFTKETTGKLE